MDNKLVSDSTSETIAFKDNDRRSSYGRPYKLKPLTEGFITTDKKVGRFLGHSPRIMPRKRNIPLEPKNTHASPCKRPRSSLHIADPPSKKNFESTVTSSNLKKMHLSSAHNDSDEDTHVMENEVGKTRVQSQNHSPLSKNKSVPANINQQLWMEPEGDMTEKESVKGSATALASETKNGAQEGARVRNIEDSISTSCEWVDGDLVWCRIEGHPFWPCIVIADQIQGKYIKIENAGTCKIHSYHIIPLGDNARRSWKKSHKMLRFKQTADYMELIEHDQKKVFEVASRNIQMWKMAIQEAEDLLEMERAARLECVTTRYSDVLRREEEKEESPGPSTSSSSGGILRNIWGRPKPVNTPPCSSTSEGGNSFLDCKIC